MRSIITAILLSIIVTSQTLPLRAQDASPKNQKLRVLVDKVITRSSRELNDQQAREIADAGFNVISPRYASLDEQAVRKTAQIAQQHNLKYMPWMRGTLETNQPPKLVWANGVEQTIYSPNSDQLWQWFNNNILMFAKISAECPALMGVFLDYEIYAPNKQGNAYSLSYDSVILEKFAQAKNIDLPNLPLDRRAQWLIDNNLHDDFSRFQVDTWRQRCKKLRQDIDAINPNFQFCIYPGASTFISQAMFPELATTQAPGIIADCSTYGRPSDLLNHDQSLQTNRNCIQKIVQNTRQSPYPLLCIGGIDPVCFGADPEFSGKNASMLAEVADGYWIFYEGPRYNQPDHQAYWKWFSRANHQIAQGKFDLWHQPRQTPDITNETAIQPKTDRTQIAFYGLSDAVRDAAENTDRYEVHTLAGLSLDYLKQFQLVVMQNFNTSATADSLLAQNLRDYVQQGGSLMFTHDTIWYMDSPFPEIATRDIPTHPLNVEADRHVVDTPVKITQAHPALGQLAPGQSFLPAFRDHMIFKPGPHGTVILKNELGDPTYVVGQSGAGKVVFTGCLFGYHNQPLQGTEKQLFLNLLNWLTEKGE